MAPYPKLFPLLGLNQNLKNLIYTVLFLFLLLGTSGFPSPASSHEIQPKVLPHEVPADQYQEFYVKNIKNTDTFAMNGEQDLRKKRRSSMTNIRRMKIKKEKTSGPFAVMLPKGMAPPPGPSQCINKYPDSARASYHCDLISTANP